MYTSIELTDVCLLLIDAIFMLCSYHANRELLQPLGRVIQHINLSAQPPPHRLLPLPQKCDRDSGNESGDVSIMETGACGYVRHGRYF